MVQTVNALTIKVCELDGSEQASPSLSTEDAGMRHEGPKGERVEREESLRRLPLLYKQFLQHGRFVVEFRPSWLFLTSLPNVLTADCA